MPIYEYRCKVCGNEYEHFQRITDESKPPCAACGAGDVQRLVSLSAFHLKGAGWYVTDYKGKNAGTAAAKSEGGEAKGDGGARSDGGATSDGGTKSDAAKPASSTSTD